MADDGLLADKRRSDSALSHDHPTLQHTPSLLDGDSDILIGTVVAGFSPNFTILLIARVVQALGSGIMMPLMMTTILDIFEPHERGKYMGIFGLVIGLAPAIGPTLSGYLLNTIIGAHSSTSLHRLPPSLSCSA